jgi:hypothetical protein
VIAQEKPSRRRTRPTEPSEPGKQTQRHQPNERGNPPGQPQTQTKQAGGARREDRDGRKHGEAEPETQKRGGYAGAFFALFRGGGLSCFYCIKRGSASKNISTDIFHRLLKSEHMFYIKNKEKCVVIPFGCAKIYGFSHSAEGVLTVTHIFSYYRESVL